MGLINNTYGKPLDAMGHGCYTINNKENERGRRDDINQDTNPAS